MGTALGASATATTCRRGHPDDTLPTPARHSRSGARADPELTMDTAHDGRGHAPPATGTTHGDTLPHTHAAPPQRHPGGAADGGHGHATGAATHRLPPGPPTGTRCPRALAAHPQRRPAAS
ncbi:hypothetical protein [Streptomyces sp. NPDC020298]|uniref:hypothetical protein n=1 Tax=unclassified Streptomyces TaxID=2593676 RepID=UPI0033C98A3A